MAIDVCSEISSPRISFSHDLNELGGDSNNPLLSHFSNSDPTIDFDFCVSRTLEISPADELFANGTIRPVQIKEIPIPIPAPKPQIKTRELDSTANKKKRLIEFLSDGDDHEKSAAKPFWQFRRSSSDNSRANGLFRSLQFLTRSNSTGSVPKPQPPAMLLSRAIHKQNSLTESSTNRRPNSPSAGMGSYGNNCSAKKPALRKSRSYGIGNGNGVGLGVNPILNIPPAYIAKGTVSLLGSFFCSKKSKKKRK